MATPRTRVSRGGGTEDFTPDTTGDDQLQLGADVALVGDPGDGAGIIPSDGNETDDDASWDVPEGQPKGGTTQKQPTTQTQTGEGDGGGFDEEDSRVAYGEQGEEDTAPQSASHRARRNARRRQAQQAMEMENADLRRKIDELTGTVGQLVQGQQGLAVNTLDGQMSTLQGQLRIVNDEMANAIKNSDGDTYQRAQDLRDTIVGRLYAMKSHRDRLAASEPQFQGGGPVRQPQNGAPQQQGPQAPDPRVASFFERFQERYDWFDPNNADANANIVRALDQELVSDGYQRHTRQFWVQLEKRLADDYGLLPNQQRRSSNGNGNGADDEFEDERPVRQMNGPTRQRPPTNGGRSTASGRAAGFKMSDVQTNILREEGLLEPNLSDEDKAKRERIVNKWRRGAQAERRGTLQ